MCIICEGNYDPETLTELDCVCCQILTDIPNTLVNLTTLGCSSLKLTSIPDTLVNLTNLICSFCPNLTSIPDSLVNLTRLIVEIVQISLPFQIPL